MVIGDVIGREQGKLVEVGVMDKDDEWEIGREVEDFGKDGEGGVQDRVGVWRGCKGRRWRRIRGCGGRSRERKVLLIKTNMS